MCKTSNPNKNYTEQFIHRIQIRIMLNQTHQSKNYWRKTQISNQ